jgi:hypothetical protein
MHSLPRLTLSVVLTVAVSFACVDLHAGEPAAAEQEVRSVEERWLSNESRPEIVASILADDFIHVLPVGFIDKNEHLQYLKQHPGAFPGVRQFEALRIRIYGDTAVATGIVKTDLGAGGAKWTAFTDVFVRRNGAWLAVNAQELSLNSSAPPGS